MVDARTSPSVVGVIVTKRVAVALATGSGISPGVVMTAHVTFLQTPCPVCDSCSCIQRNWFGECGTVVTPRSTSPNRNFAIVVKRTESGCHHLTWAFWAENIQNCFIDPLKSNPTRYITETDTTKPNHPLTDIPGSK